MEKKKKGNLWVYQACKKNLHKEDEKNSILERNIQEAAVDNDSGSEKPK